MSIFENCISPPDLSPADISPASELTLIERNAARGIVVRGETILLLYTERYHDYSLPGAFTSARFKTLVIPKQHSITGMNNSHKIYEPRSTIET